MGLFSILGKITLGPFVDAELDDDEGVICASSSLISIDVRYWSSEKIPFPIGSSILDMIENCQRTKRELFQHFCFIKYEK